MSRDESAASAFDPDAAASGPGLFGLHARPADARLVIIPVPFDATTSYRPGTARGPAAVLEASRQVDLLDREYGAVWQAGIAMLPIPARLAALSRSARRAGKPVLDAGGAKPGNRVHERALATVNAAGERVNEWVSARAEEVLDRGAMAAVLGGDHASPFGLIAALARRHPGLGILHVDAHADLREAYEGFTWSHASIFHNVMTRLPGVSRLVQVGIRDFGSRELAMVDGSKGRIRTHFEADARRELLSGRTWDGLVRRMIDELPAKVHVSFDIDGLSPELCPHTGTPVPGGLSFAECCHLLRVLSESGRRVVGFDLCEVAPGPRGDEWDANVGARVLYKLAGCALATDPGAGKQGNRRRQRA